MKHDRGDVDHSFLKELALLEDVFACLDWGFAARAFNGFRDVEAVVVVAAESVSCHCLDNGSVGDSQALE